MAKRSSMHGSRWCATIISFRRSRNASAQSCFRFPGWASLRRLGAVVSARCVCALAVDSFARHTDARAKDCDVAKSACAAPDQLPC